MQPVRQSTAQEQYIRYCKNRSGRLPFWLIGLLIAGMTMSDASSVVRAQSLTPAPGAWRPMSYADLQRPSQETATYADIWKDAIDANNRRYREGGDERFASANAPVTEAHFVIWSVQRSAVLSILDTATNCIIKSVDPAS